MNAPNANAVTTSQAPIRLVQVSAENFKRLRAVEIATKGPVTIIAGKNGQGKSSVLDAISVALGGTKLAPAKPIRKGAKSAEIIVETTLYTVTRRFTEAGGSTITVTAKDGSKLNSPQAVLDRLFGDLAFDPLAFTRMEPAKQIAVLKRIAGLEQMFETLDTERKQAEEARRDIGREVERQKAAVSLLPEVDAPAEQVSVTDLVAQIDEARQAVQSNLQERNVLIAKRARRQAILEEIDILQKELGLVDEWITQHASRVVQLVDPDIAALQAQVATAEQTNKKVEQKKRRDQAVAARDAAEKTYRNHTRRIVAIDVQKAKALAEAKLPVPNLAFTDNGLTLNGVPFEDASASEKIRTSVAMGLAQNPMLRLMLVRDGSLLDESAMAELAKLAEEYDAQVLVERVGDSAGGIGVVIEDGEVVP